MPQPALSPSAPALADLPFVSRGKGAGASVRVQASKPHLTAPPLPALPLPTLSAQEIAEISKAREGRWRPGLSNQPLHSEIFADTSDASGASVALALARDALRVAAEKDDPLSEAEDRRHVLWVQERGAIERSGRPYLHGLPPELRERLIHVEAKTPEDALFALEEGLRCRDLACVIGEILGNPKALDFTASRRLSLAAEKHDVALWMVRLDAQAELSSARMRWRVEPAPSPHPRWNPKALGAPNWKAELFRARSHAPGEWILDDDDTTLRARKPGDANDSFRSGGGAGDCSGGLGTALARQIRQRYTTGKTGAAGARHMVRATVGRSLAACARV
ncbi:MAG: recA-like protein [Pseudomonadota bacterium]|nr:recA-like protein [Pseudomonadota bacterium]